MREKTRGERREVTREKKEKEAGNENEGAKFQAAYFLFVKRAQFGEVSKRCGRTEGCRGGG